MRTATLIGLMSIGFLILGGCKEEPLPPSKTRPHRGFPAPEIDSADLSGSYFKLSDMRGKVVLLDFNAEWCGPCRMFYARGRDLVKLYKNRPFVLLGVNLDDDPANAQAAFDEGKITWRSWWDGGSGSISRRWEVGGLPTFILIDPKGIIRARWEGLAGTELERGVETLVAEAEK